MYAKGKHLKHDKVQFAVDYMFKLCLYNNMKVPKHLHVKKCFCCLSSFSFKNCGYRCIIVLKTLYNEFRTI